MEGALAVLTAWLEPLTFVGLLLAVELALALALLIPFLLVARFRAARRWRIVRRVTVVVVVLTVGALVWLDRFQLDATVRWLLDRVEAKSGLKVTFANVRGTLWTGRLEFTELAVKRGPGAETRYDLTMTSATVDVSVLGALLGRRSFDRIEVAHVRGEYARLQKPDPAKAARPFVVATLLATDVDVAVGDTAKPEMPFQARLTLARLEAAPLRSDRIWFDLLFRSSAAGALDGAPFAVVREERAGSRETRWTLTGLPMAHARPYLGVLGRVLRTGTVDLSVVGTEGQAVPARVATKWSAVLKDVNAEGTDTATGGLVEKKLAALLGSYGKQIPLDFAFEVGEEQFLNQVSFDALPILAGVTAAITDKLGIAMKLDANELKAFGAGAMEAWKKAAELLKRK